MRRRRALPFNLAYTKCRLFFLLGQFAGVFEGHCAKPRERRSVGPTSVSCLCVPPQEREREKGSGNVGVDYSFSFSHWMT